MTVHTFDRDHEVIRFDAVRTVTAAAMVIAFGAIFLLAMAQIAAVIS